MKFYIIISLSLIFSYLFPAHLYCFCFEEAGKKYNISPTLLKSIARVESGLNPKAVNRNPNGSTDMGLMQINSAWLKTLNVTRDDLMNNACLNTMTGAWVLRQCIDRHGYTWEAVGCYNAYSADKRVNYAWKVFHKLKGTSYRSDECDGQQREIKKAQTGKKNSRSSSSSFVFRVRDTSDMDRVSP